MKILVLDIETAGLKITAPIVEIGLALVDTEKKEIKPLFNKIIREKHFNPRYNSKAWIFHNSDLKVIDVMNAQPLENYKKELQDYFNLYPLTAYNKSFDLRFMRDRGFKINDIKCLMKACNPLGKAFDKNGKRKTIPSVEDMYNQFFPDSNFVEEHRGLDDAMRESEILLKLVELKKQRQSIN